MPQAGFSIGGRDVYFADVIAGVRSGEIDYPESLVRACYSDRNDSQPSASTLAGCFRQFELQRQHDYFPRIEDKLAPFFGTALHSALEAEDRKEAEGNPNIHLEVSLKRGLDLSPEKLVTLRGKADYINTTTGVGRDYKSKRYIPAGFQGSAAHRAQVNVYHWLWCHNQQPLKTWEIIYFDQSRVLTMRGEYAPLDEVEGWLRKRLTFWHQHRAAGTLPPPLDSFFGKDKKARGSCEYCEVRRHCAAVFEEGR